MLLGAAWTNRPVISRLDGIDPKQLSQDDDNDHDAPARVAISPQLLKELQEQEMNYLDQLKAKQGPRPCESPRKMCLAALAASGEESSRILKSAPVIFFRCSASSFAQTDQRRWL